MFVSILLAAAAQQIVVPLGVPKQIEQPRAPIEIAGPEFAAQCKDWDDYAKPAPPVRIFGSRESIRPFRPPASTESSTMASRSVSETPY